ncbi:MAG: VOC family protein [Pseudomonadota bacterium]
MKLHLSLPVNRLAETIDFYKILFKAQPAKVKADYAKFDPEQIPLNISFQLTEQLIDTQRHLGIEFASQNALDAYYDYIKQNHIEVYHRQSAVCCYANQDKFKVKDPNGYEWELYYLLADTQQKIEPNSLCCQRK